MSRKSYFKKNPFKDNKKFDPEASIDEEESTPWIQMRQQLLNKQNAEAQAKNFDPKKATAAEKKRAEEHRRFLITENKTPATWETFTDDEQEKSEKSATGAESKIKKKFKETTNLAKTHGGKVVRDTTNLAKTHGGKVVKSTKNLAKTQGGKVAKKFKGNNKFQRFDKSENTTDSLKEKLKAGAKAIDLTAAELNKLKKKITAKALTGRTSLADSVKDLKNRGVERFLKRNK